MPKNSIPRRYTGRKRVRPIWILCAILLLAALFLLYSWRTDPNFREAVSHLTATHGQEEPAADEANTDTPSPPDAPSSDAPSSDGETSSDGPSDSPLPENSAGLLPEGLLLTLSPERVRQDMASAVREAAELGAAGVVVDLKQQGGEILYRSSPQNAAVARAMSEDAFDLEALRILCRENGLLLVGRFSAFLDHLAAGALPDACTCVEGGVPFLDGNYRRSLDPYRTQALSYLTLLLEEICPMVDCILLSDLAFPSYGKLSLIDYPDAPDKASQLLSCLGGLQDTAQGLGSALWLEVPHQALTDQAYAAASGQTYLEQLSREDGAPPVVLSLPDGMAQEALRQSLSLLPASLQATLLLHAPAEQALSLCEALSLNGILCRPD